MRFIKAQDGTVFSTSHIVAVGSANTIRGSKGFGPYLMVALVSGRYAVPVQDDGTTWPADQLHEFLKDASDS